MLKFTKMQSFKNDYIYINCLGNELENPNNLSVVLSDRRTGIGGDGIILLCPSDIADYRMRIFNADGSEAEMCGNGIRCLGKFIYDLTGKTVLRIETGTAKRVIKRVSLNVVDNNVETVTVNLGTPEFAPALIPIASDRKIIDEHYQIDGHEFKISCLSFGNPHVVTFVDDLENLPIAHLGPLFENDKLFPNRVNTEFVKVISNDEISLRVWERGSGETCACGTGGAAASTICSLLGFTGNRVKVNFLGGTGVYDIEDEVYMTGSVETCFTGEVR